MKTKLTMIWLFSLVFISNLTAQNIVPNGDFSQYNANCTHPEDPTADPFSFAFQHGCVTSWSIYENPSQIAKSTPSLHGVPTNPYAWMWSGNGNFEAIQASVAFEAGTCYTLSFKVRTNNNGSQNASNNGQVLLWAGNVNGGTLGAVEQIFQGVIGDYLGNSWTQVVVQFTPQANFTNLLINPYYTGSPQVEMAIDDISIKDEAPVVDFHFEDTSGTIKNIFCEGEEIFLNGMASQNESQYFIDARRRAINSSGNFQYVSGLGWTQGQIVSIENLTNRFGAATFQAGYEYEIKLALGNSCHGWVPLTKRFTVQRNEIDPDFTFTSICDEDGTITVTVTAVDIFGDETYWWRLFETQNSGSILDADTIGAVSAIQSGATVTFTGLNAYSNYYVKHGVYSNCAPWNEKRIALPNTVNWPGRTSDFTIPSMSYSSGVVDVSLQADANPVFVNQWWAVFDFDTNAQVTPIQCCNQDNLTITFNAQLNKKYYVKHGIWNDCMGWKETRAAFWFGQNSESDTEEEMYYSQIAEIDFVPSEAYLEEMNYKIEAGTIIQDDIILEAVSHDDKLKNTTLGNNVVLGSQVSLYPNPAKMGEDITITVPSDYTIATIELITLSGKTTVVNYVVEQGKVDVALETNFSQGIYILKMTDVFENIVYKRLIIK